MAVPSSGELSLRRIAAEKVFDNYNVSLDGYAQGVLGTTSLTDVSTSGNSNGSTPSFDVTNTNSPSYPNGTTPHSMSEFYSYDHDATSSVSSATYYFSSTAGNSCFSTSGITVYWSGSGDALDQGHTIYTNSGLTSLATAGYYRSEEVDSLFGYSRLWSQTGGGTWFGSAAYCGV